MKNLIRRWIQNGISSYGVPPWLNPNSEHMRPSSWLGAATAVSSAQNQSLIGSLFKERWEMWNEDRQMPQRSQVFACGEESEFDDEVRSRQACVIFEQFRQDDPEVESDMWIHINGSLVSAGFDVGSVDTRQPERLREHLIRTRPNLVVIDGNLTPGRFENYKNSLLELQRKLDFSIVAIIGDLHELQKDDRLEYWGECSDVVCVYDTDNGKFRRYSNKAKIIVAPSIPFQQKVFFRDFPTRDISLGFCGGKGRRRADFMEFARDCGVPTTTIFRDDMGKSLSNDEYISFLQRSRLTFSTGFYGVVDGRRRFVLTGKIGETMLAKSVLLYESGSQIDDFFVPFVHYIPVDNVHELVHYSKFLLQNEEIADRIAESALDFYQRHYSSDLFWNKVLEMISSCARH